MSLPAPYYERDGVTIFNAETLSTLLALDANGVRADLIMADPPYGETSLQWDSWQPMFPFYAADVLAPGGSMWCFGSLRMFMQRASDFAQWRLAQEVIWEKHNGSNFHADRFRRVHESVAQFYRVSQPWDLVYKNPQFTNDATKRTVKKRNAKPPHTGEIGSVHYETYDGGPRLMRSILEFRSCNGYAVHPTQKPEGLIRVLMNYSLKPAGLVLDPYMGSGTVAVIAREMGARYIGIEGQRQYCEAAIQRLQQTVLPLVTA